MRSLLLAVALVLGQWAGVAHAGEHHALADVHQCAHCQHAQGHDGAPPSAFVSFAVAAGPDEISLAPATAPLRTPRHTYRGRAPPQPRTD